MIRGSIREPYCSQSCHDEAGRQMFAAQNQCLSGPCAFCQRRVVLSGWLSTPRSSDGAVEGSVFPWRGQWAFICPNCNNRADKFIQDIRECCQCQASLGDITTTVYSNTSATQKNNAPTPEKRVVDESPPASEPPFDESMGFKSPREWAAGAQEVLDHSWYTPQPDPASSQSTPPKSSTTNAPASLATASQSQSAKPQPAIPEVKASKVELAGAVVGHSIGKCLDGIDLGNLLSPGNPAAVAGQYRCSTCQVSYEAGRATEIALAAVFGSLPGKSSTLQPPPLLTFASGEVLPGCSKCGSSTLWSLVAAAPPPEPVAVVPVVVPASSFAVPSITARPRKWWQFWK